MTTPEQKQQKTHVKVQGGGGGDAVYGIGIFGAWAYYFKRATTTEERVKAFFKGFVWPAFLVHDALVFLEKAAPVPSEESSEK